MINNMSQGLGSFNNMMPQNNMMQQNPYGQQMNPQMMGQQMTSPEMFSEQLMAPNQMAPMQDPMQGLQPMSQPEGFGVYGQSLEGYADGGEAVPRETEIMGQPHMLAYINPEEEMMLRQMGGSGMAGPGGVPSYPPDTQKGAGANVTGSSNSGNSNRGEDRREREQQAARNLANLQAQAAAAEKMMADQAAEQANAAARREANIAPAAETKKTGIMSVVNDVKDGFKNLISDVKMTYAGGLGSFSDLNDETNYNTQYTNLTNQGYEGDEVTRYLDTTKATQAKIRNDMLDGTITDEERRAMRDERLADEARLASTAVGTGIDTIPISTSLPSGSGTVGTTYDTTGGFTPSSDFNPETGEFYSDSNTYGAMADGSQLIKSLTPNGAVYRILDPSGSSITKTFDNYQEAYAYATGTPYTPPASVMPPPSVTPPPVVTPDPIVAPIQPVPEPINTQVPAATVDPMTPVSGGFLLPGQQNFGPTPSAALNFNPNTYMQTPQNASVALPEMFQQSKPYTFEELLSQYKPAYEPIL